MKARALLEVPFLIKGSSSIHCFLTGGAISPLATCSSFLLNLHQSWLCAGRVKLSICLLHPNTFFLLLFSRFYGCLLRFLGYTTCGFLSGTSEKRRKKMFSKPSTVLQRNNQMYRRSPFHRVMISHHLTQNCML